MVANRPKVQFRYQELNMQPKELPDICVSPLLFPVSMLLKTARKRGGVGYRDDLNAAIASCR